MRSIFLDQATKSSGFAIFNDKELLSYGTLVSDVAENNPIKRMKDMKLLVKNLILKESPDFIVIEGVQFQGNQSTYGQLSQMQGVLFSLFFELNLQFAICPAVTWRSYCKIPPAKREIQKANTIKFVKEKYNKTLPEDAADAIAMGWGIMNNNNELNLYC